MEKEIKKEIWTPEKKLAYLPDFPRELFIEEAKGLYEEFLNNYLIVKLKPADIQKHTNHKIRIAELHNPDWYTSFYNSHNRPGRKLVEKSLLRIVNRCDCDLDLIGNGHYVYDTDLRKLIYLRLTDGYIDEKERIFPNNDVRAFFGLEEIKEFENERDFDDEEYEDVVPF
jgi:hypothetical protein